MANDARRGDPGEDPRDAADDMLPMTDAIRSSLAMPFCSEITAVCGPTSGASAAAALSVSYDFTVNRTMST